MTRILLVEDDRAVSAALARHLRLLGHEVVAAASIAEAHRVERDDFEVLVLDRRLPDGDGADLAALWPEASAVTMSGLPPADLVKPFGSDALVATINATLRRRRGD